MRCGGTQDADCRNSARNRRGLFPPALLGFVLIAATLVIFLTWAVLMFLALRAVTLSALAERTVSARN